MRFLIILFTIGILKLCDCKAITEVAGLSKDETVNTIPNETNVLRISMPSGEITVPTDKKYVNIKSIEVREEKNPPLSAQPPRFQRGRVPQYFLHGYGSVPRRSSYQGFPPSPQNVPLPPQANFGRQRKNFNQWPTYPEYYYQDNYDYNEVYYGNNGETDWNKNVPMINDEAMTVQPDLNENHEVQEKPRFTLKLFLDVLQFLVTCGQKYLAGELKEMGHFIITTTKSVFDDFFEQ